MRVSLAVFYYLRTFTLVLFILFVLTGTFLRTVLFWGATFLFTFDGAVVALLLAVQSSFGLLLLMLALLLFGEFMWLSL